MLFNLSDGYRYLFVLGNDGLCMLLRRLTYPNRLIDLEPIFGYSAAVISNACNMIQRMIIDNKGHLFDNLHNIPYLNQNKLLQFSQVSSKHLVMYVMFKKVTKINF